MSKKILVFRTDRIGDLIHNCPAIFTIKEYLSNSVITLIASEKNATYAKKLNIFDYIHSFPKSGIIKKIKFIKFLKRENFDYIFIFDGKERSILSTCFIKSKFKVALSQSFKFYYKFLKIKFFKDNYKTNLNELFKDMLLHCNINTEIKHHDFLKNKKDNAFSNKISAKNYIHIHLDEKWFSELYIKKYTDINPTYNQFTDFLINISENDNVLITTGINETALLNDLKNKFFEKKADNIFINKKFKNIIYLVDKPSFEDIESLLRNSKILISCHGAITHASNSFNIKKIDILQEEKKFFYMRYSAYLEDYYPIYRSDFTSLKEKLLSAIME
tara:strand:+ start:262 stop:1254 length:993 start_codon:yes stop_codon:yes gene_type:complete